MEGHSNDRKTFWFVSMGKDDGPSIFIYFFGPVHPVCPALILEWTFFGTLKLARA